MEVKLREMERATEKWEHQSHCSVHQAALLSNYHAVVDGVAEFYIKRVHVMSAKKIPLSFSLSADFYITVYWKDLSVSVFCLVFCFFPLAFFLLLFPVLCRCELMLPASFVCSCTLNFWVYRLSAKA